jgi:O-methyltransferase involved in polyketide biosynthesis
MNSLTSDLSQRNYTTITPSAKSLLFLKGYTNIPYARRTAELLSYPKPYIPDYEKKDLTFWARSLHFENRYWGINQLLEDTGVYNILELSSGYSFRSLETIKQAGYYYIDTDLPELIETKQSLIEDLRKDEAPSKGIMELLPLNALDEERFLEIVSKFPAGEIAIVNEGLLMYLSVAERRKLFGTIHKILKERGGCWITADIYIKNRIDKLHLTIDKHTQEFFEQHDIESNKYTSFEEAEEFFRQSDFVVDAKAEVPADKLSSLPYFFASLPQKRSETFQQSGKMQETWRLKIA